MNIYVDEVGRGCVAGNVTCCAVALPDGSAKIEGVKDSKKLSEKQRENLFEVLSKKLIHNVSSVSVNQIDSINIFKATYLAMSIAVKSLIQEGVKPNKIFIDGGHTLLDDDLNHIEQEAVVKGDQKMWGIGAASILAKVTRDRYIVGLDGDDRYDWKNNKGYFTPKHHAGVVLFGGTEHHRKSFNGYRQALSDFNNKEMHSGISDEEFLSMIKVKGRDKYLNEFAKWENGKFNGWL